MPPGRIPDDLTAKQLMARKLRTRKAREKYAQRKGIIELAFFDSKPLLGLHDSRVRSERSVERAHPMARFVGTLVVLWYCLSGHRGAYAVRERPWYNDKVTPTFTDMLGAPRLQMWGTRGLRRIRRGGALAGMHQESVEHALIYWLGV